MNDVEHRHSRRLKASIPCAIVSGDKTMMGQVSNLSQGGALISGTESIPPVGTPITVELQAGEERIPFTAQVRAAEPAQPADSFGVQFTESASKVEASMIRLVDALFPESEDQAPVS